jgi:hypothetical protein
VRPCVVSHLNAKATQLATGWDLRKDSASDSQPFSTGKINGAHARKRGSVSAGFLLSVEQMSSVKLLSTPGSKRSISMVRAEREIKAETSGKLLGQRQI